MVDMKSGPSVNRRSFLKNAATAAALGVNASAALPRAANAAVAADKASVYGLLAAVFRRELDVALLSALRDENLIAAFADAGVIFTPEFLNGPVDLVLEKHRVAYTALFIGPGKHIPPHASVHLDVTGELCGPATHWVRSFIEDTGFGYLSDFNDLPDHVSVELEFMRKLWAREAEALAEGDARMAERCSSRRAFFVEAHLGLWIDRFCTAVMAASEMPFYAEIAKLTQAVLAAEYSEPSLTGPALMAGADNAQPTVASVETAPN